MGIDRAAKEIKSAVYGADLDITGLFLGRSLLDRIDGGIHPESMAAYDLRQSVATLRNLANAIEAKLHAHAGAEKEAA